MKPALSRAAAAALFLCGLGSCGACAQSVGETGGDDAVAPTGSRPPSGSGPAVDAATAPVSGEDAGWGYGPSPVANFTAGWDRVPWLPECPVYQATTAKQRAAVPPLMWRA